MTFCVHALFPRSDSQLHEGDTAELSYDRTKATKVGMTYPAVVQELTETHATVQDVEGARKPLIVPRSAVKLPAAGAGILLLVAGRAGATEVAVGLLRRGVHLGIIDTDQNTALHLAITNGHEACAVSLVDLGYVEEERAGTVRGVVGTPVNLAASLSLPLVIRKLSPTPGDREASSGRLIRPLHVASRQGDLVTVEALISASVDLG